MAPILAVIKYLTYDSKLLIVPLMFSKSFLTLEAKLSLLGHFVCSLTCCLHSLRPDEQKMPYHNKISLK